MRIKEHRYCAPPKMYNGPYRTSVKLSEYRRNLAYKSWKCMMQRCYYKKDIAYRYYGGRGIKVCIRWATSFGRFLQDMGERPEGYVLDRINSDLGYFPSNCRWYSHSLNSKEIGKYRRAIRLGNNANLKLH